MKRLVQQFARIYDRKIEKLVIVYECWQPMYDDIISLLPATVPVLKFQGLQAEVFAKKTLTSSSASSNAVTVAIFDDLAASLLKKNFESQFIRLLTIHCHHWSVSAFFLLQTATFRTATLSLLLNNASYFYLTFYLTRPSSTVLLTLQVHCSGTHKLKNSIYTPANYVFFRN